eukprot:GGOE01001072.1.p1 GENE.GGOE01001072.1~~GGOE01001072.1.p1  ORF type:complete len:1276 (-),score=488.69 GGOE01001072.1:250-4077(-)
MVPNNVQRLMITSMELENFKSYAGVQHIGPFHKFFSSIVGPNGSGKSNVIDALLFVFGFKASKIRLKRIGELVHTSAKHPSLPMARVTVHFTEIIDKEGDEYDEIPGTQFAISRTAHVDNKSEYFINSRKSTFAEITTLLREKGIDLDHNRFLILQGEVEAISLMPPKARNENEIGMLEYLEDIIGTAGYKDQIEAASREVDELNEQREAILNLVKASQKDRDSLQGAKAEAETYLRVEADFVRAQSLCHQLTSDRLSKRRGDCEKRLGVVKATFAEHQKGVEEADAELTAAEARWKAYKQDAEKREKAVKIAADAFAKLERNRTELQENNKDRSKKLKKMAESIRKDEAAVRLQHTTLQQAEQDVQQALEEIKAGRPQLQKFEAELEKLAKSLEVEMEPHRKNLEKKKREILPYQQKLNQAESELQVQEAERKLLVAKKDEVAKKLDAELEAYDRLKRELAQVDTDMDVWEKAKLKMDREQQEMVAQFDETTRLRDQAHAQYRAAVRSCEELKANAAASSVQSGVVDFLMKQKKSGNLPGIHGRLGDLGAIDSKYDVAISTACPQLNFIVVEDVATGQRCLEVLRANDVGRCTVIVLEKQQHLHAKAHARIDTPENVSRLYNLVKIKDEKFRVAFYWALNETLVAENMEHATRIAFSGNKRWRVVTLDGKLIETSGTMSGGGAPQKGLMSGKLRDEVDPQEVKRLEAEVTKWKAQLDQYTGTEEQLQQKIRESRATIERSQSEAMKRQALLQGKKQALSDAEKRLVALKTQLQAAAGAEDAQELKRMDTAVQRCQAKRDEVKRSMQALEQAIKTAEDELNDVGGVPYKSLKFKVESTAKELEDKEKQVTKLQVTIKNTQQAVKKLEAKVAKDKKEHQDAESQEVRSKDALDQSEKEYLKMKQAHEMLKAEAASVQGNGDALRDELAKAKKKRAALQTKGVDMEHKVKQNEAELNKMDAELRTFEKRIDELDAQLLKNIREYGSDFLHGVQDELEETQQTQSQRVMDDSDEEMEDQRPTRGKKRKANPRVALPPLAKRRKTETITTRVEPERLQEYDLDKVRYDVTVLEETLQRMRPNLQVLVDWREKDADYKQKVDRLDKATQSRNDKLKECEALKKQRLTQFMKAFQTITMKLKEMYQMLTLGGDADLELVDNLDPFSEGIVFSVRPNKKAWKQISNLSGGEKTLSSLALVFALHHYQPSPLYVLDEIDAALDFKNVSIVAHYIKEQAVNAQFIIISLRNNMFELANRLVGIYKTNDCTRSVAINPQAFMVSA